LRRRDGCCPLSFYWTNITNTITLRDDEGGEWSRSEGVERGMEKKF
jgi:hypothetical protein